MDLHHPLIAEFPEHTSIIKTLNASDGYFHALVEEYDRIDDEICRIEENLQWATDQEIEELKLRRVRLKDKLYNMLRHAPAVAA